MRFVIPVLLLAAACSKKPAAPLEKGAGEARQTLDKAIEAFTQMSAQEKQFKQLLPKAEGNEAAAKELDDLRKKNQKLGGEYRKLLQDARDAAELVLKTHPDEAEALDVAAIAAYRFGDFDAASGHLEHLTKIKPDDSRLPARLAMLLRSKTKYAEARALLKPVLEKHPDEATALAEDGANAYCLNDLEVALQRLEAAALQKGAITGDMAFDLGLMLEEVRMTAENWKKEFDIRSAETRADDLPRVKFETARGDIVFELFENEAPNCVANFVDLVDKQFYDGTRFHFVMPDKLVQGGDPISKDPEAKDVGRGGPGYFIDDELPKDKFRRSFRGSLVLVHAEPGHNGSQFAITHRPIPGLDGRYTIFGRVIQGQEIVDILESRDLLTHATVLRKRDHSYRPTLKD